MTDMDDFTLIDITVTCTNPECMNVDIPITLQVPDVGQGSAQCGPCGAVLWTRDA